MLHFAHSGMKYWMICVYASQETLQQRSTLRKWFLLLNELYLSTRPDIIGERDVIFIQIMLSFLNCFFPPVMVQ